MGALKDLFLQEKQQHYDDNVNFFIKFKTAIDICCCCWISWVVCFCWFISTLCICLLNLYLSILRFLISNSSFLTVTSSSFFSRKYENVSEPRSSQRRCSLRKGIVWNFAKFTRKHLCQSLFFDKVAGLGPATLSKKRLWPRCFPVNFSKVLRTPFYRTPSRDCTWEPDLFLFAFEMWNYSLF